MRTFHHLTYIPETDEFTWARLIDFVNNNFPADTVVFSEDDLQPSYEINRCFYLRNNNSELISVVFCSYTRNKVVPDIQIYNVCTSKEKRREGHMKALLQFMINQFKAEWSRFECWLAIDTKDYPLYCKLYEHEGFEREYESKYCVYHRYKYNTNSLEEEKEIETVAKNNNDIMTSKESTPLVSPKSDIDDPSDFMIVETATALKFVSTFS
jgi:GNAT superfamily N-acetyltransferase